MSFIHFVRILIKNILWLLAIPTVLAGSIYYFTRNEVKVYASETTIYTGIASGYSLSGNNKADFFATSNAFDNLLSLINSRETKQEVVVDLLSEHIFLKKHDPDLLTWGPYEWLQQTLPDSVKKAVLKPSLEETKTAVRNYMLTNEKNWVFELINSNHPYYSIEALKNIKALRISQSDLIKISYETTDAPICKRTLELVLQEFMLKYKMLKIGQSESVVNYFERETKSAYGRLDSNEANFLDFNKTNDIINYYEQTRSLAGEKELLYAQNHNLEMDKMADSKTLEKVNTNLEGRVYKILNGTDIIKEREKLGEVYNKLAVTEVIAKDKSPQVQQSIDSLKNLAKGIEHNLKKAMDNLYAESNTPNGIPTRSVLEEWLKSTLAYEQSQAKLTVMDKRKKEFQIEYRKFAPLGAMLKKIERQIGVSEKEYLELLHGLSTARLYQQNNELTTKLTTVDPPFMPLSPIPSKRMIQVIVGFLVGFILILTYLLAKTLVNKTIQQPEKAKKIIGVPLMGIYPLLREEKVFLAKANLRLMQHLISKIDLKQKPATIGVLSAQKLEGKSTICQMFQEEISKLNMKAEVQQWSLNYFPAAKPETDIVLLEFPALEDMPMKPGEIPLLQQSLLICRANRIWTKVDTELLNLFKKITAKEPLCIINGVDRDFAEDQIGELPKKRSGIRMFFKKQLRFDFGNKTKIK